MLVKGSAGTHSKDAYFAVITYHALHLIHDGNWNVFRAYIQNNLVFNSYAKSAFVFQCMEYAVISD